MWIQSCLQGTLNLARNSFVSYFLQLPSYPQINPMLQPDSYEWVCKGCSKGGNGQYQKLSNTNRDLSYV